MTVVQRTRLFVLTLALLASSSLATSRSAMAQEPTGLQAAAAIEQAMVNAIGTAEKSVVSIARISNDGTPAGRDDLPFGRPGNPRMIRGGASEPDDPRDPEFVPKEFATGVVIDAKGLILTAYHCVLKGDLHKITTINRKLFNTSIYAADPRSDLAVLKVDADQKIADDDFVPIKFGDAKKLRKGQIVVTLGNPFGIARDGQVSASWGIVSNLSRKLGPKPQGEEPTLHQFGTLIQTDARLNWGTSGGALVNLKGEMVGLTTSLAAGGGFEQAAGYAIPIDDTFRRVVDTLKQGKEVEYGFLGISPGKIVRPEMAAGRHGLMVHNVTPDGPAARAGVQDGVMVTHINGEPVYDFDDLRLLVGRFAAGATTTLTYEQPEFGQTRVATVALAKYRKHSLSKAREPIISVAEPMWRGLQVDYATAVVELRVSRFTRITTRVAISEVLPDSPAAKAGLATGMFLSNVGNTPIDSPADFRNAVAKLKGPVTLQIIGDFDSPRYLTVEEK